ncbi:MAG: dienelactone hydrolase [Proteobacteria bacterium]|nr:dienelactone hydrolase [Pseudomonadota bacterium]
MRLLAAPKVIPVGHGRNSPILLACLAAIALLVSHPTSIGAAPRQFNAAFTRITIQDTTPFDVLIAYPTDQPEVSVHVGPFTLAASRDAAIAKAGPFPVVLFSHGNGRSGGTPLLSHDIITSLARQGFIVVAPFHPGTRPALKVRPRQLRKALDSFLGDPRFSNEADRNRLAVMGFSFGGAVALIAAGAHPDLAHWSVYCRNRTDDPKACDGVPPNLPPMSPDGSTFQNSLRVKALVLLDPLGAVFDAAGLISVTMPTLLFRPAQSDLQAEGNIINVAQALPASPRLITIPGGHFIFAAPCSPALAAESPAVCKDAPGVDRVAIHRQVETEIVNFLRQNLN